ncbi:hypothetical protein Lal_00021561 [Lupinus albus]|uniref:RING-type E3 ubiquitin transferase n=1 Tax=Lupinus albus TaxID=3870 RepID=A0A6A4NQV5_LUPAL|nr:putative transcription factor C2H2 family [Lupinus albus]KAF1860518.1 hypothetical protein Lal_00021561 [Lupinus albus]
MDLVSKRYLIYVSQHEAHSPITSQGSSSIFHPIMHHSSTSFPIIAIAIIGILSTTFLLVSYYIFVIKCCLNWHNIDLLRRFSPSTRREDRSPRGLNEALIRLIPLIQYKTKQEGSSISSNREFGERSFCECAVCLNEFQEDERLRIIPNCSHVFHIDCIDVWLQNNANCPLCRTSISLTSIFQIDKYIPNEDFVVIELCNNDRGQNNVLELLPTCHIINPSQRRKVHNKVISMGDECIDIRAYDQFSVQPIRRSFSMDSSGDRHFYLTVQEALQQSKQVIDEVSSIEGCSGSGSGSGRAKRSFFSFGHLSRSKSSVQPVYLDP